MNRINRKDRVLLESMNEKYGTDVVAQAILALSGAEGESVQKSPQVAISFLDAWFVLWNFIGRLMRGLNMI